MAFCIFLDRVCHLKRTICHYNIAMSPSLFFRVASVATVIAIWILSFLPGSAMPDVPGSDKWHHALAYFACMFCWAQIYRLPVQRLQLAIAITLMGILIECLQDLTTYRSFEWLDMVADAVGVTMAWLVVTVQLAVQRRYASHSRRVDPPPR